MLAAVEMRQLDQRISIRATLKPLNREEVEAYIAHRLWVARGSTAVTFEPAALDLVHAFTGGVPRIINLLCDRSLMQSAQMRVNRMTAGIIEEGAASLGLRLPVAGRPKDKAPHGGTALRRVERIAGGAGGPQRCSALAVGGKLRHSVDALDAGDAVDEL